jgi:hypothetical protein
MIIRGGSNIVFDSWFVLIKYFRSDYIVHLWKLEEKNHELIALHTNDTIEPIVQPTMEPSPCPLCRHTLLTRDAPYGDLHSLDPMW